MECTAKKRTEANLEKRTKLKFSTRSQGSSGDAVVPEGAKHSKRKHFC